MRTFIVPNRTDCYHCDSNMYLYNAVKEGVQKSRVWFEYLSQMRLQSGLQESDAHAGADDADGSQQHSGDPQQREHTGCMEKSTSWNRW